ncbi:MAG: DUF1015 domain-containing protein [Candidatus Atribacteria bacterium]|nr:DUF1015 domain-containing protein [Candidatus Atribacteria bacterium]
MIEISPFKALRPTPESISYVNSPPYDVVGQNEAAQVISENPDSFLKVVKPEAIIPSGKKIAYTQLAKIAAKNLKSMIDRKVMMIEQEPCFYVYQQIDGSYQRTGLVACLSIMDYQKGLIRKHEKIRIKPWKERVQHIKITRAHTGCPLIFFKDDEMIEIIINRAKVVQNAIYDFISDDGVRNRCWKINQEDMMASLGKAFIEIENVYIADGHHRVAAAAEVARLEDQAQKSSRKGNRLSEEYFYFPALLVPHNQIRILGYHRLVKIHSGFSPNLFLQKLKKDFMIEKITPNQSFLPSKKHEFGMNLNQQWYRLFLKESNSILSDDFVDHLDVAILQNQVLFPLLDIVDPQKSKRIGFIGGQNSLSILDQEIKNGSKIAFTLYPTTANEVMEISDHNEIMPPKSTWFDPKVRSGIFVHQF